MYNHSPPLCLRASVLSSLQRGGVWTARQASIHPPEADESRSVTRERSRARVAGAQSTSGGGRAGAAGVAEAPPARHRAPPPVPGRYAWAVSAPENVARPAASQPGIAWPSLPLRNVSGRELFCCRGEAYSGIHFHRTHVLAASLTGSLEILKNSTVATACLALFGVPHARFAGTRQGSALCGA